MRSTGKRMTPQGARVTKSTARIQITVEIEAQQPWGADCTIDQVFRQAASDALAKVSRLIGHEGRIVGEPRVAAVMVEEVQR